MHKTTTFVLLACLAVVAVGQTDDEKIDPVDIIKKHGLQNSQVMDHLSWICDVYGPRLTGSPNLDRAQKWAVETFKKWGLANPHTEEWGPFGRGWKLESYGMRITGENAWPVHSWPKAWSPSINGKLKAEVILVGDKTKEQLEAMDLEGKIVLIQAPREVSEWFKGTAHRFDAEEMLAMADGRSTARPRRAARAGDNRSSFVRRGQMMQIIFAKNPAVLLDRGSKGEYGTIFVSSASVASDPNAPRARRMRPWNKDAKVIPQFTLAVEHYNRICRLIALGRPVEMEVELTTKYNDDDPMERNVIAEIPGTDPKIGDQVVMLGAHFDSWHSSTGATDNGCGSATMMEATRILMELSKELGRGPRRTIRVALWTGEEQGLLGSRAYVNQHFAVRGGRGQPPTEIKPEHAKLAGYFNMDNGTGRLRGVYLQKNAAVAPIFREWLKPFHDMGATTLTLNNTGGTDHQSFDGVGLPGFQFIQDPAAYRPRTHHSNMDSWDHAIADDLKQAATIIASFVWNAAERDEMLPRKPMPKPTPRN